MHLKKIKKKAKKAQSQGLIGRERQKKQWKLERMQNPSVAHYFKKKSK